MVWPQYKIDKVNKILAGGQELAVLIAKILITKIQVNLCCLIHRNQHKFT